MNRTKIEWTRGPSGEPGRTWNPIRGLCPQACWFCYARRLYRRFKLDERLAFHVTRGELAKMDRLPPSRIFICSTMEMFHPKVETAWRDKIFYTIEMFPKHTFIILTKRPERIDRPMPPNVWLGVTVTGETASVDYNRVQELERVSAKVRFVSAEPLLGDLCVFDLFDSFTPDWLIVGRLTGHGKKYDPRLGTLDDIWDYYMANNVRLFVKNNLKGIWPGPLIQEFPR